jgi:hypothetical protein
LTEIDSSTSAKCRLDRLPSLTNLCFVLTNLLGREEESKLTDLCQIKTRTSKVFLNPFEATVNAPYLGSSHLHPLATQRNKEENIRTAEKVDSGMPTMRKTGRDEPSNALCRTQHEVKASANKKIFRVVKAFRWWGRSR